MAKSIPITDWRPGAPNRIVDRFFARPAFPEAAEKVAREILADIRQRGDRAVADYAEKFDGVRMTARRFRVTEAEIAAAKKLVDPAFKRAAREADRRPFEEARDGADS